MQKVESWIKTETEKQIDCKAIIKLVVVEKVNDKDISVCETLINSFAERNSFIHSHF